MILYLVRHGQSEGNVKRYFHGQTDYPLTDHGREQAKEVAEKLKDVAFTRCCTSDLQRAYQTALACLAHHRDVEPEIVTDLREHFVGDMEDLPWEEAERRFPGIPEKFINDWFHTVPPNGEDPQQMLLRVGRAIDTIIERGEDTLVVSHFGTMSLIAVHLGIMTEEEIIRTGFGQGCYTAVEITDGKATLLCLNK